MNLKMLRQLLLSEKMQRDDLKTIGSQNSTGNDVARVLIDLRFRTPEDPIFQKEWWAEAQALIVKIVIEEGTGLENHYMACLMYGVDVRAHGQVAIDRGSVYSNQLFLNVEGADHNAHRLAINKRGN